MAAVTCEFVAIVSIIVAGIGTEITCSPLIPSVITTCYYPQHPNVTYETIFGQPDIEATETIARILPLIPEMDEACARAMRNFLCAVYAPPSDSNTGVAMPPCHPLCLAASRCQKQMTGRGIGWKDEWNCATFPPNSELCVHYEGKALSGCACNC